MSVFDKTAIEGAQNNFSSIKNQLQNIVCDDAVQ